MITQQEQLSYYSLPGIKISNYNEKNLIQDVCDYFKVPVEDIKNRGRNFRLNRCRQVVTYFLCQRFPKSDANPRNTLQFLGDMVGRDHATVLHSCKTVINDMDASPLYKKMIKEIEDFIENRIIKNNNL